MIEYSETQETIIGDENAEISLSPTESLSQELIPEELIPDPDEQNIDCASEKVFWKYARCILYFNLFLSQFRVIVYILIGLVRFMCCDIKKCRAAAIEALKSVLVFFAAIAAIYVTQNLVNIHHCIGEVIFEFFMGGLTLQICLGLGDAFIHTLFGCTTINCTVHKIIESILEPIVFIGGFFYIFTYCKSVKGSKEAQYAKYSALGNLIGSFIATAIAIYLCLQIEEDANKNAAWEAHIHQQRNDFDKQLIELQNKLNNDFNDLNNQLHGLNNTFIPIKNEWSDFKDDVKEMYDPKNAILAMNMIARIFAEGIAKLVEHKCIYRRLPVHVIDI